MSAGVWSSPCSWTERMLNMAEERLLKDMVDVQLMALFTKDLSQAQRKVHPLLSQHWLICTWWDLGLIVTW